MKRFLLLAILLTMADVSVSQSLGQPREGVSEKQSRTNAQHPTNANNEQQAAETAALNSISSAITKDEQERSDERQQETTNVNETIKPEWWLVYVGIAQAIALIFTLIAICIQTRKTAETVQVMRDGLPLQKSSADAAFMNAQAVINGQRAWFLFDHTKTIEVGEFGSGNPQTFMARVYFKNFGKTVGRQTAFQFGLYVTAVNEVPNPNAYEITGVFKPIIIAQDDPLPYVAELKNNGGNIPRNEWDDFLGEHAQKLLWLCGIIKYEDVFRPGIEHETRICRCYGRWIPKQDPFFKLAGPVGYNGET